TSAMLATLAAGRFATRVPGLRRIPMIEVVLAGQVLLLARQHLERLTPRERRRIIVLIRDCRGLIHHLSDRERAELQELVAKVEPRLFAETALRTLSPMPVPKRVTRR